MPRFGDPTYYYGDLAGYVAWSGSRVVRTADILASPVVWETVDSGIDGTIIDAQLVIDVDGAALMFLLTSTALWLCEDIRAVSPAWAELLTVETVRTSDASTGVVGNLIGLKCFAASQSNPNFVCVATGPMGTDGDSFDYQHAYFWHSDNRGQSWASVDYPNSITNLGHTRGHCFADNFAMEIAPGEEGEIGTVYCVRTTPNVGLTFSRRVYYSTDGAHTWALKGSGSFGQGSNNQHYAGLLAADAALGRPGYVVIGSVGVSNRPDLYRSTDDWATTSELTANNDPTGYGGIDNEQWYRRVGNRYNDPDHLLCWFRHSTTDTSHLLESTNQGDDWALVYIASTLNAQYQHPINWPPDPDTWVWVQHRNTGQATISAAVWFTVDGFDNAVDATGNLDSVLTSWLEGPGGGFALPKEAAPTPGLAATITSLLRIEAGRQSAFDSPAAMEVAIPAVFEYSDAQEEHSAPYDSGLWTPVRIVDQVSDFARFTLKGAGIFEVMPLLFEAGYGALTPSGAGPYLYEGEVLPGVVGAPVAYTYRFGGDNAGVTHGSMIQIADAYLQTLHIELDLDTKTPIYTATFFGRRIDDNEGAGYQPSNQPLPANLALIQGLRGTLGLQSATDTGGLFDDLTSLDCELMDWSLDLDTGLRPMWSGDQNQLTYCGVTFVEPFVRFQPTVRTNLNTYALILTQAQQRVYTELALTVEGDDSRSLALRLTGRFLAKLGAHERARDEVVMRPVFLAEVPHTQTTTPHWFSWEISTQWNFPPAAWNVSGVVAAYEPINAGSLAESYINLANPGVNDAAPGVAPTFAAGVGWTFDGSTQYLTSGLAPAAGYSMIVRFSGVSGNEAVAAGSSNSGANFFLLAPRTSLATFHNYGYTSGIVVAPALAAGVMAIAAEDCYLNGALEGSTTPGAITSQPIAIGAQNNGGTITKFLAGTITHLYIYNRTLTAEEIAAITEAIA